MPAPNDDVRKWSCWQRSRLSVSGPSPCLRRAKNSLRAPRAKPKANRPTSRSSKWAPARLNHYGYGDRRSQINNDDDAQRSCDLRRVQRFGCEPQRVAGAFRSLRQWLREARKPGHRLIGKPHMQGVHRTADDDRRLLHKQLREGDGHDERHRQSHYKPTGEECGGAEGTNGSLFRQRARQNSKAAPSNGNRSLGAGLVLSKGGSWRMPAPALVARWWLRGGRLQRA